LDACTTEIAWCSERSGFPSWGMRSGVAVSQILKMDKNTTSRRPESLGPGFANGLGRFLFEYLSLRIWYLLLFPWLLRWVS
jgi:hypothetical protein